MRNASMRSLLRQALRRLYRDESGQSLIVIVSSMFVLVGIAAFSIDTATWMVRHHQAQIVADSAALAAAQCLASPGQSNNIELGGSVKSLPVCSTSSDTGDAQRVAVDYAAANGLTISPANVNVNTTSDTVTVSASASSPGFFARLFGLNTTTQSAGAGASWTQGTSACTTPGGTNCDFMFAHDETCQGALAGIYISNNGNSTVNGRIQTNGNLTVSTNGNISLGNGSYGPSSNGACAPTTQYNGHYPWNSAPTQDPVNYPYPIDYTKDFPACGGSDESPCAASGYPSFCTNEGASITLTGNGNGDSTISGNVYCAVGSGTKSDPSTWNGSITISLNGSDTLYDTYVGGTLSFTGNGSDELSSCGYTVSGYSAADCNSSVPAPTTTNYPIFYATGTASDAIDIQINGSQTLNGDMFAPNGGASLQMNGNKSLTTFIEANDIDAQINGTFEGDGPTAGSASNSGGDGVALVQ